MRRIVTHLATVIACLLLAAPLAAQAAEKVAKIGFLVPGLGYPAMVEAFRQGLALNLKTAKVIGRIAPSLLLRADRIIE